MQAKIPGSVIFFTLLKALLIGNVYITFLGNLLDELLDDFFGQFFYVFLFQLFSSPDTVHSVGLALEA